MSVKYSAYSLCCLIVQDDFDGMYSCLFGIVCHLYCIGPSLACVLLGFACVFWYVLSFEVFSPQIAFPALSFASVFARCFCKCPVACAMVCHVLALATSLAVCVLSEAAGGWACLAGGALPASCQPWRTRSTRSPGRLCGAFHRPALKEP